MAGPIASCELTYQLPVNLKSGEVNIYYKSSMGEQKVMVNLTATETLPTWQ